jgi:hypothetical protein
MRAPSLICHLLYFFLLSAPTTTTLAHPQQLTYPEPEPLPTPKPTPIKKPKFALPTGYTTTTYDIDGTPTPRAKDTFFNGTSTSLAALWNQVGPIQSPKRIEINLNELPPAAGAVDYSAPGLFHGLVASRDVNLTSKKLPKNFMWGVASSAYQIEGAAKFDGKGPSIWDLLSHRVPGFVTDNSTGDVVAENYFMYKEDIRRLKQLGIPAYSPSISWPRLFPLGRGAVNSLAMEHYDDLISTLLSAGITPVLTLFHWDTPLQLFNEYGGWTHPNIVDDFFEYAKFVITRYDKYVPIWYTINEPQYCNWQFSTWPDDGTYWPKYGNWSGGKEGIVRRRFLCGHNTLLAHAKVAKWYHGEFKVSSALTESLE